MDTPGFPVIALPAGQGQINGSIASHLSEPSTRIHFTSQKFEYSLSSVSLPLRYQDGLQTELALVQPAGGSDESEVIAHQLCSIWVRDSFVETLNGGIKQGSSIRKNQVQALDEKKRSKLCKLSWFNDVKQAWTVLKQRENGSPSQNKSAGDEIGDTTYHDLKHTNQHYQVTKSLLRGQIENLEEHNGVSDKSQLMLAHFLSRTKGQAGFLIGPEAGTGQAIEEARSEDAEKPYDSEVGDGESGKISPFTGWLVSGKIFESFKSDGSILRAETGH